MSETEPTPKTYADFTLPSTVVMRRDVSRLVDEVERIDNELTAAEVRAKTGAPTVAPPIFSEQLSEFLQQNSLSLEGGHDRTDLITQLRILKDKVPIIHMTFAVEADHESLGQLVAWLRESVHPQAVIAVGLQPALVAGVYLRTPNHVHDLSLRAKLQGSRELLVKELESYRG